LGIYQAKSNPRVVVYLGLIDQIRLTAHVCFHPYLPHERVGYECQIKQSRGLSKKERQTYWQSC